jgi:hypothetical protein
MTNQDDTERAAQNHTAVDIYRHARSPRCVSPNAGDAEDSRTREFHDSERYLRRRVRWSPGEQFLVARLTALVGWFVWVARD